MMKVLAIFLLLLGLVSSVYAQGRVVRVGAYPAPPETGAWSYATLGAGICSSVSENAGTLSITAAGIGIDDGCLVFQTLSDTDVQVYGRIGSITGTAASTTSAGPMIANNSANTSAHCNVRWQVGGGWVSGVYQVDENQIDNGGIFGSATALPVHLGLSFVDSTNRCKMFEYDTATVPANPLTDFDGVPQPFSHVSINMSDSFLAGFYVQSGHATNTATVTITDYDVGNAATLVDNAVPARDVDYRLDYETAGIQAQSLAHDGAFVAALRNDEDGVPELLSTQGCCDYDLEADTPDTTFDVQVLKTSNPTTPIDGVAYTGSAVSPIEGTFFSKHAIYSTKDYSPINGNSADKARTGLLGCRDADCEYAILYDTSYWYGFSVYIPNNYPPSPTDLQVQISQIDGGNNKYVFSLVIKDDCNTGTCGSLPNGNAWEARLFKNDGTKVSYHIGTDQIIGVDTNVWTSFVVNMKSDDSGSTGFIKIWKTTGQKVSGECRGFPLNPQVDYTGELGMTRVAGVDRMSVAHPRIYKPNWNLNPDGVTGPIELYFDAAYVGPDTTTDFEDVNPCGLSAGSAVP